MSIDTNAPVPIYYQLKEEILKKILSGELSPGERIESEEKLAQRYSISRMTARHAVTQLVNDDYLYRVHGRGTFVCKPRVEKSVAVLTGFADDMKKKGFKVYSRVVSLQKIKPSEEAAEILNLKAGEEIYELIRVRFANDLAISYQITCLPVDLYPDLDQIDFSNRSLYETLSEDYDILPLHASQQMEARNIYGDIAGALDVEDGAAVFYVERITYCEGKRPMELAYSWHRGDKYVFEMKLYSEN